MRLDRKLNFVTHVDRDDGSTVHVHSMPLRKEVFEQYYLVISKTFSAVFGESLSFLGGPRVCSFLLRDIAKSMPRLDVKGQTSNWLEGPDGVQNGLINEIRRMTNVLVPQEGGWKSIPFEEALAGDIFSEAEALEVEGEITFFILNSAMQTNVSFKGIMTAGAGLWGWEITFSSLAEYITFLQTSTKGETIDPKVTASSTLV